MKTITTLLFATCLLLAPGPGADDETPRTLEQTAASAQADLKKALADLAALRERISREKLPLNRKMNELETELVDARGRFQDTSRMLDTKNLSLTTAETEIKASKDEQSYLSNLLAEYLRSFETRIHIAEKQRYAEPLQRAHEAPTNGNLGPAEVFEQQLVMVEGSLDRLLDLSGGARFDGTAVDPEDGKVKPATFALLGPVAVYRATDGSSAGLAQEVLNSLEPNMIRLDDPALSDRIGALVADGSGSLPLDPTLGNAQKIEETNETFVAHVVNAIGWPPGTGKGGPVMLPIILMAAAATLVSFAKLFQLSRVPQPSQKKVNLLLAAVKDGDIRAAQTRVKGIEGPTGDMLRGGVESITEPKTLIEEVMFEKTLETRLKLQSYLPFVQVAAAAAPLLGLLGTVTGIINTFKLITVFGTGDAKTLSGGISEALITTEFGLVIAIPSLLMHAYLSRRARRILDAMEKTGVAFLNRVRPGLGAPISQLGQRDETDHGQGLPQPPGAGQERPADAAALALPVAVPATQATDH